MKLRLTELLTIGTMVAAVPLLAQTYTIQDLGALPGTSESLGVALNDLGQACGVCVSNGYFATLFSDGQAIDLGASISGDFTYAEDIDNSGVVVGYEYANGTGPTHAVIWSNGTIQDITSTSLFPAGEIATAITKESGVVVVGGIYYNTNTAVPHAGLYSNGVWTDLGILHGATRGTVAYSINSAGQILAIAAYQAIYKPFHPAKTVPCILRNGVWVDLNKLIPTNSGFNLSRPVSINDAGQILVNTKTPNNDSFKHAVLLTPK